MATGKKSKRATGVSRAMQRRKFLVLAGLAGVVWPALPPWQRRAHAGAEPPAAQAVPEKPPVLGEPTYWQRTDSFEEKMKLLESAWRRKDFRLVRALTHSLRTTAMQAQ